ncbi:hypothetical protein [Nocardia sp. NPDC050710]|uniref:hypothetical protein n=1 Tax=Nocardia sp. NPDC050710 TaxID=3157220 RepID=UPI0033DDEE81
MAGEGYLRGVLADGARRFRYRNEVRTLLGLPDEVGERVSFAPPMRGGFVGVARSGEFAAESGAAPAARRSSLPTWIFDVDTAVVDSDASARDTVVSRSAESFDAWAAVPITEIPPRVTTFIEHTDRQDVRRHGSGVPSTDGDAGSSAIPSTAPPTAGDRGTDGGAVYSTVPQWISPSAPPAGLDRSQQDPVPVTPEYVAGIRHVDRIPGDSAPVISHGSAPETTELPGRAAYDMGRTMPDARAIPATVAPPVRDAAAAPMVRPGGSAAADPGEADTPPMPDSAVSQGDSPRRNRSAVGSVRPSEHRPASARTVSPRPVRGPATGTFPTVDDADMPEWSHPPNRASEDPAAAPPPVVRDIVVARTASAHDGAIAFWERRYLSLLRLRSLR